MKKFCRNNKANGAFKKVKKVPAPTARPAAATKNNTQILMLTHCLYFPYKPTRMLPHPSYVVILYFLSSTMMLRTFMAQCSHQPQCQLGQRLFSPMKYSSCLQKL